MKGVVVMYITNLQKTNTGYSALIQKAKGTSEYYLRNEISLDFDVSNDEVRIQSGWLIGADEMVLNCSDKDIVDHFFPGLITQLKDEVQKMAA